MLPLILQPLSPAARLCDHPGGPAAVGFGGDRWGFFQLGEFVAKAVRFGLVWSGLVRSLWPAEPGCRGFRFQVSGFGVSSSPPR